MSSGWERGRVFTVKRSAVYRIDQWIRLRSWCMGLWYGMLLTWVLTAFTEHPLPYWVVMIAVGIRLTAWLAMWRAERLATLMWVVPPDQKA